MTSRVCTQTQHNLGNSGWRLLASNRHQPPRPSLLVWRAMPTRPEPIARTATVSVVADFAWRTQAGSAAPGLVPVVNRAKGLPLLKLPEFGFYVSYGWRRDPMDEGNGVPGLHGGKEPSYKTTVRRFWSTTRSLERGQRLSLESSFDAVLSPSLIGLGCLR